MQGNDKAWNFVTLSVREEIINDKLSSYLIPIWAKHKDFLAGIGPVWSVIAPFTHASTTLSPFIKHDAHRICFVPPLAFPFL